MKYTEKVTAEKAAAYALAVSASQQCENAIEQEMSSAKELEVPSPPLFCHVVTYSKHRTNICKIT